MKKQKPSEVLYEKMLLESHSKGSRRDKTIKNLKQACDKIAATGGEWTCAEVARLAENTPVLQTIYNNKEYRNYISLREEEYLYNINWLQGKSRTKTQGSNTPYPLDGLDIKGQQAFEFYINRNKYLEVLLERKDNEDLRRSQQHEEDFAEAISLGPDENLSLQTPHPREHAQPPPRMTPAVVSVIQKIFNLALSIPEVNIYDRDNQRTLVKENPFGRDIILTPEELNTLETFIPPNE